MALAGLSLGRWALDPAFAPDTLQYAAIVGNEVSSITVTATVRSADAAVQLLDVNDNALADADAAAEGHQASLSPGPNTIKATVTAGDGTTTRTYTLVITRDGPGGVCARTPQIRDGIVRAVRNVDACAEVTGEHLKTITNLSTRNRGIESLRTDDFAGLSAVRSLFLDRNRLTILPADVFAEMTALEELWLQGNRIEALPTGIFAGLPAIETILLDNNRLNSLPQGIFSSLPTLKSLSIGHNRLPGIPTGLFSGLTSIERIDIDANEIRSVSREMFTGLTSLKHLSMQNNPIGSLPADLFSSMTSLEILSLYGLTLTELPEGIFSGLRSIKSLGIGGIQLSRVPAGLFSGLTTLESLTMHRMGLTSLPDGVFSGLTALESLWLVDNNISSLPQDVFSGLTSLDRLGLAGNNLASLPANLFSGLTALEDILLSENQLRSLPPGIFVGLSSIAELELQGNAVFPLPVSVTLEKVGTSQFKAVAPTAAPFALEIGIGVSASGEIAGGANTVTIPAGSVESAPLAVNRVAGTEDPVTVDIRGLPNPPGDHRGYALEKDGALPLELAPRAGPETDATLSALVLSDGTLSPSFVKGVTSYTATVGNAVSSITVTPTKSKDNARVAFLDANDNVLADADTNTDGQQVDLSVGENTLKVKVTAEDNATTLTYTIVVTRNSVPVITTTSPLIVEENRTAVATLQATDADGDEITWSSQGGADADRFDLTAVGELAFDTAPDFESPSDADANNEYVIVVRASDGTETVDLALTVQVTDVDDSPSDDAGLSGLSLSVGTLDPAFDTATASYTATVANGVSSITVTPTKSDANATLAYRDANDAELDDADGNTPGRQAALRVGENTIKVRVTAEDATTTRTYTIVVTRLVATDVCERTEQVRDAIVAGISGVNDCQDVTNAQLSGIIGLDISGERASRRCNRVISTVWPG